MTTKTTTMTTKTTTVTTKTTTTKTTTTKTTTMTTKTTITPVLEHSWKKSLQSGNTSRRMMMRVKIVFSEDNDN